MDRQTADSIYNDRELNKLRIQSEELINSIEQLTDEEYRAAAAQIKKAMDQKIAELYEKYKTK